MQRTFGSCVWIAPRHSQQAQRGAGGESGNHSLVAGEEIQQLPRDLYIPPEALEVFLETFEGLDLLLYLIRRQNLDILQVQVSVITAQYMAYIELMQALQLELAAIFVDGCDARRD